MANKAGNRFECGKCSTQMMVTKGGEGALACCVKTNNIVPNQLGKRFSCESCGTEALCIKGGTGQIQCCGVDMVLQQPKVLPSAD